MSIITQNSKNIHNPMVEYLCSDVHELIDLADELEQRLKEVDGGEKLRKLFHKLLMQIQIKETSDVLKSESDETNQACSHVKPNSLYSPLIDRMVENLRKERQNWTQKMWAEDMLQNMEQSRIQAVADGTAIDEDWELKQMSYFPDTLKIKTFPCGGIAISDEEKITAILIEAQFIQNFISNGFGFKQFLKLFKKKELSPILSELIYAFGENGTNFVIRITPTELVAYQNTKNSEMFLRSLNIDFKIFNEQNPFSLFLCTSKDKMTQILNKYWGHTLIFEIYVIDRSKTPLLMEIWENHTGKDSKNLLESLKLSRFFLSGADGDELEILSYMSDADLITPKLEFIAQRNGIKVERSLLEDGAEKYFSISDFVGENTP